MSEIGERLLTIQKGLSADDRHELAMTLIVLAQPGQGRGRLEKLGRETILKLLEAGIIRKVGTSGWSRRPSPDEYEFASAAIANLFQDPGFDTDKKFLIVP